MLQLKRLLEKLLTLSLKGPAAVKPRQRIVIPFMLNTQPLSGNRRHIFHQTYLRIVLLRIVLLRIVLLRIVLLCSLHPHITDISIRKRYMIDPVSCIAFAGWTIAAKFPQDLLKVLFTQIFLFFLRHTEDTEKVLRHINLWWITSDLISPKIHTGHLHDPQKFRWRIDHILAQLSHSCGKVIQFPYVCSRKLRHGRRIFLRHSYFPRKSCYGGRQITADEQTADHPKCQNQQDCQTHKDHHMIRKGKKIFTFHRSHQCPLLMEKRGISTIQSQRTNCGIAFSLRILQPVLSLFLRKYQIAAGKFLHTSQWRGTGCLPKIDRLSGKLFFRGDQMIGSVFLIFKFLVRKQGLHVRSEHFHSDHTIDRAIWKDQRYGIGNSGTVISLQHIGLSCPPSVCFCFQLLLILKGSLKNRINKTLLLQCFRRKRRKPAFIRRNIHLFYQLDRWTFQKKVGVFFGRWRQWIQVTDVDTRKNTIFLSLIQILRIENHKNTGYRFAPERLDKIPGNCLQKWHGIFSTLIQVLKIYSFFTEKHFCDTVDPIWQFLQILIFQHDVFQICTSVFHLFFHDIHGILIHLWSHLAEVKDSQEHQDFQPQNTQHCSQNHLENRFFLLHYPWDPSFPV